MVKQKPIRTKYDRFGGYSEPSKTYEIKSPFKTWRVRKAANSELLFPIADEVDQLICDSEVLDYWRNQEKVAFQKAKKQQFTVSTKHIHFLYAILAEIHDEYMPHSRIITTKETPILYNPKMCKSYLRYIRRDLEDKGLLKRPPEKAAKDLSQSKDQEKGRQPKEDKSSKEKTVIYSIREDLFTKGTKNWNLLMDLIADVGQKGEREGVSISKARHGSSQPRPLRAALKKMERKDIAELIIQVKGKVRKFKLSVSYKQIRLVKT